MVELNTRKKATGLLTQTGIADLDIRVTPHRNLNSSKGVISKANLVNETDADLLEGLKDQGIKAVLL